MQTILKLSVLTAYLVLSVPAMAASPRGSSESPRGSEILLEDIESGGYGAPVARYSRIGSQDGLLVGARGGWIINHRFVIGAAGYGLATSHQLPGDRLSFAYGGLMLEYIFAPKSLFHFAFNTVIGGGAIGPRNTTNPTGVFIVEPELDALVNLTPSIRAGLGVSYRLTRGPSIANVSSSDLSGFGANVLVQFGSF